MHRAGDIGRKDLELAKIRWWQEMPRAHSFEIRMCRLKPALCTFFDFCGKLWMNPESTVCYCQDHGSAPLTLKNHLTNLALARQREQTLRIGLKTSTIRDKWPMTNHELDIEKIYIYLVTCESASLGKVHRSRWCHSEWSSMRYKMNAFWFDALE